MPVRTFGSLAPIDLRRTVEFHTAGRGDPAFLFDGPSVWMATRTPDGPATTRFDTTGTRVEAEAWGPGAEWALDRAPDTVGANDDPSGFAPVDTVVSDLAKRFRGVRITRTALVTEITLRTVVGQVVTGKEAKTSFRRMTMALGDRAPGPTPLFLPPDPERVAASAYTTFHPWGIERRRAETLIRVARHHKRLDEAADMPLDDAHRRLRAVRGVGVWTAAKVASTALGDPDAVPVGDYHLANVVTWALTAEPRGTDEQMLELLDPYRGHRGRVIRLLQAAGVHAPKFGPRRQLRSFERI